MRTLVLLAAISCAALSALAVAGCGGGGKTEAQAEKGSGGEAAREEREREEAAKRIPVQDRVAYYQLTTTSGLIRSDLIATQRGTGRAATVSPGELESALRRVARVHPGDRGLMVARRNVASIGRATVSGVSRARAAELLRRLDGVNIALSQFLRRHPAQSTLIPD